ncbi:hypothetical protein CBR_g23519 [Chara braunii]|uniref:Right handed beta helix domain-containing protein n=1 Tax=Chara braunii TaxID=69332 RepID=A0A388L4M0_CHABU|nr:hypothetical protein CBR_g23519 [Chara braunii]|eukprot:GBG77192.1 hypothetical protein CBR_g23519 [Chara braunii]
MCWPRGTCCLLVWLAAMAVVIFVPLPAARGEDTTLVRGEKGEKEEEEEGAGTAAGYGARGGRYDHTVSRFLGLNEDGDPLGSTDEKKLAEAIADPKVSFFVLQKNMAILSPLPILSGKKFSVIGNCGSEGGRCVIKGGRKTNGFVTGDAAGTTLILQDLEMVGFTTANSTSGNTGAAVFIPLGGHLVVHNCLFWSNRAGAGAGIHIRRGSYKISHSQFVDNVAEVLGGGAILADGGARGIVTGTKFHKNRAPRMGAAFVGIGGTVSFTTVEFKSNEVGFFGGAISINDVSATFLNTSFVSNSAKEAMAKGGAVRILSRSANTTFCCDTSFSHNTCPQEPDAGNDIHISGDGGEVRFCGGAIPPQWHVKISGNVIVTTVPDTPDCTHEPEPEL